MPLIAEWAPDPKPIDPNVHLWILTGHLHSRIDSVAYPGFTIAVAASAYRCLFVRLRSNNRAEPRFEKLSKVGCAGFWNIGCPFFAGCWIYAVLLSRTGTYDCRSCCYCENGRSWESHHLSVIWDYYWG